MAYRYAKYLEMGAKQIHNALVTKGLHPSVMEQVKIIIAEQKTKRRADRAHRVQMGLQWGELVAPLTHERKIVRSVMRYKGGSTERTTALQAYLAVLDKLTERLTLMRREHNQTPLQLHPERHHWADYVPQHIKNRVVDLFDAVPHTPKAKRKRPFVRTVPAILHNKQRDRLLRRTTKDLGRAQSEGDEALTKQISQALDTIKRLPQGEPVPATWHGLLGI
jgi:hypothetical protein